MWTSRQIPNLYRDPPAQRVCYFHEFYAGLQYLYAGYEVMVWYRAVEDRICYEKACELFGGPLHEQGNSIAGKFIAPNGEREGRAPDLIVFDPATLCFRFVECKGKREKFTARQVERFQDIESHLNKIFPNGERLLDNPRRRDLFPEVPKTRKQPPPHKWLHIARLEPVQA